MRVNNANFEELNQRPQRELRLVVSIEFDGSNIVYFTSHSDISGLSGTVVQGVVKDLSAVSQKLDPINALASIGSISFILVDKAGAVTAQFRTQDVAGRGLRGSTVRLYSGFKGLAWADFRLEQTQIVDTAVTFDGHEYKVQCRDIQRELNKDIFEPAKTKLAANFLAGATTMTVYDTSEFEMCPHGPSFVADSPGTLASPVKVGYLKLKYDNGWEIVSYTGKTSSTFTGITRGRFNTRDIDHVISGTPSEENGIEVEEFIYLELPAPKLIYALQTGILLGQPGGSNTLPASWHSAISTAFVDVNQVNNIGDQWYKASDDTGFVLRFDSLSKTDAKAFIEKEILLAMGAFAPINAAGQLGLRLQTRVLAGSSYVAHWTVDDIVDFGDITDSLSDVHNEFDIQWGYAEYPNKKDFFKRNVLVDAISMAKHKKATPTTFKFKGIHPSKHTESTVLNLFNGTRDRYAGPPKKNKLQLLPSKNNAEIGDTVRVTVPQIRDFTSNGYFDRVGEVQGFSIDQSSQRVTADMFYSTMPASAVADIQTGNVLTDAFYSSAGTALANVSGGNLTADTTVSGGSSLAATIRYVLGDLTIPSGRVLNLSGNVQIRVRGYLDIKGTVNITGGMGAGVAGIVGNTRGDGAVRAKNNGSVKGGTWTFTSSEGPLVAGKYPSIPSYPVEFNGTTLTGIPDDLRGSGGATGGSYTDFADVVHAGAAGGIGGGGALFISRGGSIDPLTGKVVTSGSDGSPGGYFANYSGDMDISAGSGAGGHPGCLLWLIDGNKLTATPSAVNGVSFIAKHGNTPVPTSANKRFDKPVVKTKDSSPNWYSYYVGTGGFDAGTDACFRVQVIPKSRIAVPDNLLPDQTIPITFRQATQPTNANAQTAARRNLAAGDLWYDSDDNNKGYRFNGSTWDLVHYTGSPVTFRQTAAPSDADAQTAANRNRIAGDIWFDSDDGDRRYRWSGSTWVAADIESRLNLNGRPTNQRFLRAFHAPATQAAKAGGALSAADVGSTATITVPAWSIETDVGTISYNSGSITGLSFGTKYYVYCTDADLQGGTVTYVASTDYKAPSQNADRVYVGTITTPADGGSGTGGGSGGGDYCVAVTALLPDVGGGKPWRAALARAGKALLVLNETDDGTVVWPIRSVDFATADCLELETISGIKLTISTSTPITLKGGEVIRAPECLGREVPVLDNGEFRWEPVISLRPAGLQTVARVHADQLTYAAGDQPDRYILTHNPTQKP